MISTAILLLVVASLRPARGGIKYPDCASGPLRSNLVCNTSATPEARAQALVAAMSNSEKLANMIK
jgi:xylan 1,4-beta-xylosidase